MSLNTICVCLSSAHGKGIRKRTDIRNINRLHMVPPHYFHKRDVQAPSGFMSNTNLRIRGSVLGLARHKTARPVFCIMFPSPATGLIWRERNQRSFTSSHFSLVVSATLKHLSGGGKGSARVMSEGDGGSRRRLRRY